MDGYSGGLLNLVAVPIFGALEGKQRQERAFGERQGFPEWIALPKGGSSSARARWRGAWICVGGDLKP